MVWYFKKHGFLDLGLLVVTCFLYHFFQIHNWTTKPSRQNQSVTMRTVCNTRPGLISFSLEKCTLEKWRASELMRGQLTSELKAKWKFNDSAPLHQTQIVSSASKKLALSRCCSDLHWRGAYFVALHTWTVVVWWYFTMAEEPKGRVLCF